MVTITELQKKGVYIDCFYLYMVNTVAALRNPECPITCHIEGYKMVAENAAYRFRNRVVKAIVSDSLKYIGDNAFYMCHKLKSFPLLEGLLEIGEKSFCDCLSLEIKSLPSSLLEIGMGAFAECDISSIFKIPPKIKVIREKTFYNTHGLKELYIPSSVREIKDYAFSSSGVEKVYLSRTTKVSSTAFDNCPKVKFIYQ